jgi:hypothetical protein
MSIVSLIIEPTNFTPTRCDFNIPALLCDKMKLCHLGVYGGNGIPLDPVLGQLAVISKITLRDGGVILSEYNRNIKSAMKLKLLDSGSNDDFRSKRRNLDGSIAGFELRRAGETDAAISPGAAARIMEQEVVPKVCIDKKDPPRVRVAEAETRFAVLDIADVLGWCSAVYTGGSAVLSGSMPCHIHKQLKLSIEFAVPNTVATNATTIAQPYLIFREAQDATAEKAYMNANLVANYSDWEMESVWVGAGTSSKVFLNSFYNKTVSKLAMINETDGTGQSQALVGEVFRLLVNNVPYFQLTTGINHEAKKAALTRLAGYELPIALHSDKTTATATRMWPANPDDNNTSICEGADADDVSGSLWFRAANSYLVLPINQLINQLQIDWSIGAAPANLTLQFWGQVEKRVGFSTNAPVVAYA